MTGVNFYLLNSLEIERDKSEKGKEPIISLTKAILGLMTSFISQSCLSSSLEAMTSIFFIISV